MYIVVEKENDKLNFYSDSGDGVTLFDSLDKVRATVESLKQAEKALFGDVKTEFGYIEFGDSDIKHLDNKVLSSKGKIFIKRPKTYEDSLKEYMSLLEEVASQIFKCKCYTFIDGDECVGVLESFDDNVSGDVLQDFYKDYVEVLVGELF